MKEYKTEIEINASKEAVWKAITCFEDYPNWNSILIMKENDSLVIGEEFDVTINKPNGKHSKFKATLISKEDHRSFSASATIVGKWFFEAIHYFIINEIDKEHITFIQKWELKGIITSMSCKQIFKELEDFKRMNNELKKLVEK